MTDSHDPTKPFGYGKVMVIEQFPEEMIQLNIETSKHPKLMELLAQQDYHEFEIRLGVIAAYCEVIVDGIYTHKDILELCELLTKKLKLKNVINVAIETQKGFYRGGH